MKLSSNTKTFFIFSLIYGGILFYLYSEGDTMDIKMLFGKTAYTKGYINEYTSDIESEPPVFEYDYSFPLNGEVYVDYSFHSRYVDSSSQVNIEYLVSDPNISRIEGTTNTPTGLTYIYLFVGLSIFQGILLIKSLKKDISRKPSK